jgi:hypothetical protein
MAGGRPDGMLDPLAYGGKGQSPWLWLVILGGGVVLYLLGRRRQPRQTMTWADVGDRLFMVGVPWWGQALFLAIIGGGSLYHLATGNHPWYWWLLPAVAWLAFAWVLATRDR